MAEVIHRQMKIDGELLRGWRLLERFQKVLEGVRERVEPTRRESHGLRKLDAEGYLSLFLLAMFNPVLGSMRALSKASELERVQQECGTAGPVGLSRFSEAQAVFDPELLRLAMSDLVEESVGEIKSSGGRFPLEALRIVDSTLWKVVPRMGWAEWRYQSIRQQAVRLHLKLRVCDEAPTGAVVTSGKTCERSTWRENWQPGEIYLGDRNFGGDYGMLEEMERKGCDFLIRLGNRAVLHWESEEVLSEAARQAGITKAGMARLGAKTPKGPWRVILLERPGQEDVMLVASACWAEMSTEEVAGFYRHRWKIEQFFRWLKCLVPCRHWLAESPQGVSFQIYLTLIAALLLAQTLGARPNKRMWELLQFHQMGWATDEELLEGLLKEARQAARKRELAARKASAKKAL